MGRRAITRSSLTLLVLLSARICFGADGGAATPADLPARILDDSAPRWRVDCFAGNSMGGQQFVQGPARQTAGLYGPAAVCAPDGTVYMTAGTESKWAASRIVRVTPDGRLRLLAGGGASLEDGPASRALIRVNTRTAPGLAYSKADNSLYFCHSTIPCVRRLCQQQKGGEWLVQTVAGSTTESGTADGAGAAARFAGPRNMAMDSKGVIYVLDGTEKTFWMLRRIEKGKVSTVVRFKGGENLVDGPFETATIAILMCGMIATGETDDILYIADMGHTAVRRIDLRAKTITTVAGMPKPKEWRPEKQTPQEKRHGANSDGPALTMASFNAGCAFACWDPTRKVLWCGGPDETSVRWLKDGWLRTVLPPKATGIFYGNPERVLDGTGMKSSDMAPMSWLYVRDVDARGNVYLYNGACPTGLWRAYEMDAKGTAR